jgi:putative tryptophan/tyrosine transport system substrate-binding protein
MLEDSTMWRRTIGIIVIVVLAILAASLTAAQSPGKVAHLGWLASSKPPSEAERQRSPFWQALCQRGWIEGQNLAVESRYADGRYERLPDLAAELVRLPIDVLVTPLSTHAALAAKAATRAIPIVFYGISDPVELGLVTHLAQPGGNITGVSIQAGWELAPKRLQLLKEAVPQISRVMVLWNPDQPTHHVTLGATKDAAGALGVQVDALGVRNPTEVEQACHASTSQPASGLIVLGDAMFWTERHRIVQCAIRSRLPAVYIDRWWVEAGGLMSYGADSADLRQHAAILVDKILNGAKPADLPVEQPTRFEFVINLKTAQALGLTIPPTVLFQATEVIR